MNMQAGCIIGVSCLVFCNFLFLQIKAGLLAERSKLKVGDPTEFDSFTSAVIDDKAFQRIKSYIDRANSSKNLTIIGGGKCDNRWVALYVGKLKRIITVIIEI
jgi:acyl-CoA reductase-like NAD-dependent aldehyde dehydrogenase